MKSLILSILTFCVLALSSCESLREFSRSPLGQVVISTGAAYIVAQSIEKNPDLEPVLLALADHREGIPVDFQTFDEPLIGLGSLTVSQVAAHYGDEATDDLIVDSIRTGVAMAQPLIATK